MTTLHLPRLRTTLALLAAATLALLVTAFLLVRTPDPPPPARAFFAEITVEVDPSPEDPLARIAAHGGGSLVRWWYAPDPDRWRWEIETVGTTIDDGLLLTVFDGENAWGYDDRSNAYQRAVVPIVPQGMVLPPTFSAPLGPANVPTIQAFMEEWRDRGNDTDVSLAGEATLLGRRTQIVELRPAWQRAEAFDAAPASGQDSQPSTPETESSGGVIRVFIDPERMFIMRWAVDGEGGGQSFRSEVTTLEYDTEIDATRFSFDPPPAAVEATRSAQQSCSGSDGPFGGPAVPGQPGFLRPSYVPPGYNSAGGGSQGSATGGCESVATWVILESPNGAYIVLRQRLRPGGIPRTASTWQPVDSNLDDAYSQSQDGVVSLLWRNGDVVALLETDSVSFEELLRIAESSALVAAPPPPTALASRQHSP